LAGKRKRKVFGGWGRKGILGRNGRELRGYVGLEGSITTTEGKGGRRGQAIKDRPARGSGRGTQAIAQETEEQWTQIHGNKE